MPGVYLDVHVVLNIACLTSLKIAIALPCIISYIELTHQAAAIQRIQRGSDCRLTPFRILVEMTYMLPFSENVLCIEMIQKNHSCCTQVSLLLLYISYAIGCMMVMPTSPL